MSHFVYVPTGGEQRLLIIELDPASGALAFRGEIELRAAGSAMCTDPDRRYLYVTTRQESDIAVATYAIDPGSGGLSFIGEVDLEGCQPCYLATDRSGRFLLAAYYSDGLVTVHPIGADGAACGPRADRHETERYATGWPPTPPTATPSCRTSRAQTRSTSSFSTRTAAG